jgi:hypothetical protein
MSWKPDYIESPLDAEDIRVANFLKIGFELKRKNGNVGADSAVSNKRLCEAVDIHLDIKIKPARMRKIINYVRCIGTIQDLCASSKGYFIAADTKEMNAYLTESLYPRIMSQLYMFSKLRKNSSFQGLMELPFEEEFEKVLSEEYNNMLKIHK